MEIALAVSAALLIVVMLCVWLARRAPHPGSAWPVILPESEVEKAVTLNRMLKSGLITSEEFAAGVNTLRRAMGFQDLPPKA